LSAVVQFFIGKHFLVFHQSPGDAEQLCGQLYPKNVHHSLFPLTSFELFGKPASEKGVPRRGDDC